MNYNGVIIPKSLKNKFLKNNDKIEIVHFIGGVKLKKDILKIANKKLKSRLDSWHRKI